MYLLVGVSAVPVSRFKQRAIGLKVNEFEVTISKPDLKTKVKMVKHYFDHSDAANNLQNALKKL
jgi:translation initiation factor IF-3